VKHKVKILQLINTLSAGGAELHLLTLCRHLKRQGVEVIVACLKEKVKGSRSLRLDFEKEGIRVINLGADRRFDLRCIVRLIRLLKEDRPDVLHTHLPRADFGGAIGHWIYPNIPWICSIHGVYSTHWSGRWSLPMFDFVWRRADAIVAISQAVKDWLVQERRIPSERIEVIYYGIEPNRLAKENYNPRRHWDLDGKFVIGSIGRLEPLKGFQTLIQAMPILLQELPNASLVIAGHDPWGYGKALDTLIEQLQLSRHVRLVGFESDVPSFLHSIDVFAFASTSEGFGQVVIEAMAAEKPVVVSKIPPLTEIVVHDESGFLVDPGNPAAFAETIVSLLKNEQQARRIGEQGAKRVRDVFSAERMTQKTLQLYGTLLS
jgi:glycosyltransferase involved in cell wall biosynthesis